MKPALLILITVCWASLHGMTQVPSFEYVLYQKDTRKATIQLPDFTVELKKGYKEERSVFKEPSKLFVVSDIEGQYDTFKQLLQSAGVIDKNFNWTFGKGHLVVCGDVFDRGDKVTECLWLIYYLEEKAKKAGGYVHYILGNHELMNLTGDLRYLNPRYQELARQKNVGYDQFYAKQTELGRWLRTKNVMVKIGNQLFLHGGVSQYMNDLDLYIDSINIMARQYYDLKDDEMPPLAQLLLLDDGPLWYRGYFTEPPATIKQVDSTLLKFRVKKIIIGHTPVDRISSFYEGKVINVDVPHARGVSEGLFIDGKKFYTINLQGKKTPFGEQDGR